jgi:hypothetical protein
LIRSGILLTHTVEEAAVLIAGFDPNWVIFKNNEASHFSTTRENEFADIGRIRIAYTALKNAFNANKLLAKINYPAEPEFLAWGTNHNYESCFQHGAVEVRTEQNNFAVLPEPDLSRTLIEVFALRNWLKEMGISTGFFFPNTSKVQTVEYLDPNHPRYAPKLAASVNAWLAVTDPKKISPKKALEKWLRENAARFGMTDDEGNPVTQAVDDCSKIANWQLTGGAPKSSSD